MAMVMSMREAARIAGRASGEQRQQPARDAEMLRMADAGDSLAEIGRHFGVSREWARQIVARERAKRATPAA